MVSMTDQPADDAATATGGPAGTEATGADAAAADAAATAVPAAGATAADGRPALRRGHGDNKVIAGVCHGAGRYFDVDPVIIRIVLAVLALTGGIGLIIYGLGWLVVPQEDEQESEAHRLLSGRIEGAPLVAVLMALVGCGLYASLLGNAANQAFSLILLGSTVAALYWSQQRSRLRAAGEGPLTAAGSVADAPPAAQAPPGPGSAPSWWRDPLTKAPPYLWGPDDGPYEGPDQQPWRERRRAERKERNWPFGLAAFLVAATAAVVGTSVSLPRTSVGSSLEIGLLSALFVFGAAYLVASFAGRPRGLTAFWTLLTVAGLVGAAWLPKDQPGWGTTWAPASAAAVRPGYERGVGHGVLDLTNAAAHGRTVTTRLRVRAGEALVRLPKDATVVLSYHIGAGEVLLPGEDHSGVDIKTGAHDTKVYAARPGTASAGTVEVRVDVAVGDVRVVR